MNQPQPAPGVRPLPEEVHLQDYINVIVRRRKLFLGTFAAVFVGVALVTFIMHPVYEAAATLHIKDEKGKMGLLGELALNSVNPVDSELEILKSRSNSENVVKRLHLDWQVTKKSEGLSFRPVEFSSSAKNPVYRVELTGRDTYTVRDDDSGMIVGSGRSGLPLHGKNVTLLLADLQGKSGDSFNLQLLPFNETVETVRKGLKAAEIGKKTSIISVSYRDKDPERARDVVNTLIQVYLEQAVAFKTEEASRTVGFVEDQLKGVRDELDNAEKNLQSYKTGSGVVQLDSEAQNLIETMAGAEKQKADIVLQKKQIEFALGSLRDARRRGNNYSPAVMRDDPLLAGFASRLAELEVQKRALLTDNTENHPAVRNVQGQIEEIQKKVQATYETTLQGLTRQEANVGQLVARYEGQLKTLPVAERDLARLTRLSKVNADIYTFLLQKHEEARIAKASTISNINIVDPAITPDNPVKPQKKKNLLLGLLVGGMFGVGMAFFREYLDDTIKDSEEAKRALGWPVLAVIPCIKHNLKAERDPQHILVSQLEPNSVAAESFRSLRTSIHFSSVNCDKKLILVTSAFPGEGKTTIAANLAITITHTGSRVLIVDCDLRRSSLHEKFGHSRTPGLTELLAGDVELEYCIHNTGITGLDVISAGTVTPNPAELLGSETMSNFLAEQRQHYDFIIIDAPPTLAVTDAAMLTTMSDLVVLVLDAGHVPRKAAARMREILLSTKAHVAGIILNDKTGNTAGYGYYGSGYGYYGEEENAANKVKPWWRRFF